MKDVSLKQKLRRGGAVLLVTMVCLTGLVGCNPDKAAAGKGAGSKANGGKDAGNKDNGGKPKPPVTGKPGGKSGN